MINQKSCIHIRYLVLCMGIIPMYIEGMQNNLRAPQQSQQQGSHESSNMIKKARPLLPQIPSLCKITIAALVGAYLGARWAPKRHLDYKKPIYCNGKIIGYCCDDAWKTRDATKKVEYMLKGAFWTGVSTAFFLKYRR